ncbi:MAG: hypothetical protein ACRDQZ_09685 [Mycobacteriales bacterium]
MTLLYTGKFEKLDDALAERRARALIEEPLGELTIEEEYQAIVEALGSDATLTRVIELPEWIKGHTEQEFRDFLQRLLNQLDAKRPWLEPAHRELSFRGWSDYHYARVVGRIKLPYLAASGSATSRTNYGFRHVNEGDHKRNVLILRLRSGDEVALAGPWWPNSKDVALLSRDPQRTPQQIVGALIDATRFTPEEIEPIHADDRAAPREEFPPDFTGHEQSQK